MKKLTIFIFIIIAIVLIPNFSNAKVRDHSEKSATINGVCGTGLSSVKGAVNSGNKPTENLCSQGKVISKNGAPAIVSADGNWIWICGGINNGKNSPKCETAILGNNSKDSNSNTTTTPTNYGDASSKASLLVPACPTGGCGFDQLMTLINKVIKFLLVDIATPLAAIVFAYAGFLLITAGGDPGQVTKAKSIIKNLLIGFVIALAAWLIINTILTGLGATSSFLTH